MVFSSVTFLALFLPLCLCGYYSMRRSVKAKNALLLCFSLAFYAWGEPWFVIVMMLSIILNWLFGRAVHARREDKAGKRLVIVVMLIVNLGLIFTWKYSAFFVKTFNGVFGTGFTVPEIALPIGISFFTLQAISYVLDIAMKGYSPLKSVFDVALYISFFPQLIAGPIVRYETIADQMYNRKETVEDFVQGFNRLCRGLFKKVMIANSLAPLADSVFGAVPDGLSAGAAWLGAVAYAFQIYFDFSGYSDMALGLGKMFGFHFLENFEHPYASRSISEFWRRWHISLGSWFRDYVYFPMGGSRVKGKPRLLFNLFVVWLLTGVWHGANFTFALWGLFFFVLISIEKLSGYEKKVSDRLGPLCVLPTALLVTLGWVLFRSPSISAALSYYVAMIGLSSPGPAAPSTILLLRENVVVLVLGAILSFPWLGKSSESLASRGAALRLAVSLGDVVMLAVSVAALVKGSFNPFIYFNF